MEIRCALAQTRTGILTRSLQVELHGRAGYCVYGVGNKNFAGNRKVPSRCSLSGLWARGRRCRSRSITLWATRRAETSSSRAQFNVEARSRGAMATAWVRLS
eukprot:216348-Rhodomonas_salina.2